MIIAGTKQQGFTLLELLIAVVVFAILSVMAYGGLSNVIDNSQRTDISMQRLQEVQMAMLKITRDFSQVTERNIRDEYGNSNNFILSGSGLETFIEFSRGGRRNPAQMTRSNLQRVAYRLEDNKLSRLHWPQLDRSSQMEAFDSVLLDRVESADVRFLDSNNAWHDEWPPLSNTGQATDDDISLAAIEFKMILQDWGELSRLFLVNAI